MRFKISKKTIVLASFFWVFSCHIAVATTMYRLEDDQGKVIYSDKIPPDRAKYQRELLNKEARPVEVTEKAKSKEQQDLENRLKVLRQAQEKIIARQKIHDDALLSTYDSSEAIAADLEDRMQIFEARRAMLGKALESAIRQLDNLLKAAASFERNGQQVPKDSLDNIKSAKLQVEQAKTAIQANTDKQKLSRDEYHADIERYLFLTQSAKKPTSGLRIPNIKEANALGLFYCENDHQCNKAWEIARAFVNQHSTTLPDVFNDRLIMNRPPKKETDISLSISRIEISDNDYELFLDIHCHDSVPGQQLCTSQKVRDIRSSFRPYVNDALSGTPQQ
ncbi:MAG: hypothetical protein PHR16_02510 [Methylovulum sp.]|nr:hypothetical protein [Methylovulum sp.]